MIPGFYYIWGINASINRLFKLLFDRSQAVQKNITDTVPTVDTLNEKEEVYYISGSTYRKYVKLNGSLYYWDLTAV